MIQNVYIQNFRGVKSAVLQGVNGRVYATGHNGHGKTGLLGALQFAWTGECYNQHGKRIENADLVGPNGKEASIVQEILVDGEVLSFEVMVSKTRQVCRVMQAGGELMAGTPKEVRAALWKRMGGNAQYARAGLHSRQFLLADDIIQAVTALYGGVDHDRLVELCGAHWSWLQKFAQARSLPLGTPAGLSKIGDAAFAARTEVNRTAKELQVQIDAGAVPLPRATDGRELLPEELPKINEYLGSLNDERDTLLRRLGASTGTHTEGEIAAEVQAVESEIATWAKPEPSTAALRIERKRIADLHAAEAKILDPLILRRTEITAQIEKLKTSAPICVTCKRAYKPTDIAKLLPPLEAELASLNGQIGEKSPYVESLADSLTAVDERIADATVAEQTYNEAMTTLNARLKALRALEPRTDADGVEDEIAEVDASIARCNEIIKALIAHQAIDTLRRQHAAKVAEAENLNWAIAGFRDAEITNQLSAGGMEAFVAQVNAALEAFGVTLSIEGEAGQMSVYFTRRGVKRNIAEASNGELLVCQLGVVTVFGQGVVTIDNLDALVGEWKQEALYRINEIPGSVFLAGASTAAAEELVDWLAPAVTVWVQDGVAEVIGTEVAA